MFEGWGEFYLMAGSAAAVLIGLIFVVITLVQDRPRSTILTGNRLYMGPIVLGVSFTLALSAAALVPDLAALDMAAITTVIAVWGLARAVQSILGIRGFRADDNPPHWTDLWFYGAIPCLIYIALGLVAWGFWTGAEWAVGGLAGIVIAILLLSIRNEWDLVTWLAPRADSNEPIEGG